MVRWSAITYLARAGCARKYEIVRLASAGAAAQAQADDMGMLPTSAEGQRDGAGEPSIDLRSVTNGLRQLPYHVARARGNACAHPPPPPPPAPPILAKRLPAPTIRPHLIEAPASTCASAHTDLITSVRMPA